MTTILLAIAAVKFAGGTPNDFVTALADATGQNIVMSQGEGKNLTKAEFETSDISEMAKAIRSQLQHVILPGNDLILSDQMLARRLITGGQTRSFSGAGEREQMEAAIQAMREQEERQSGRVINRPSNAFAPTFVSPPPGSVAAGKVTFKTEKANAVHLESLTGSFSKPIVAHWIYSETPIYVNVKDMAELDFLKWAAKATGARLVNTPKEFHFELDAVEIKKRAIAAIQGDPGRLGRRDDPAQAEKQKAFRISVINGLTPAQLGEALAANGSTTRIELNNRSPLTRVAINRIRDMEQYQRNQPADGPGDRNAVGLLQRVDSSRPAVLMVDSRLNARMEIPVLGPNGQPAGVVRL